MCELNLLWPWIVQIVVVYTVALQIKSRCFFIAKATEVWAHWRLPTTRVVMSSCIGGGGGGGGGHILMIAVEGDRDFTEWAELP